MHGVTGFVESAALLVFAAFVLVTICSRIASDLMADWDHPGPRRRIQPDAAVGSSTSGIVAEEFAGPLLLAIGMSMLAGSVMVRWAGLKV
jgi:hypothetical protein